MIIDCHVHVNAFLPADGHTSAELQRSVPFRYLRWRLGLRGSNGDTQRAVERKLVECLDGATHLDAAVVLAFDAVYDDDGRLDRERTHLHVTNDYVIELARRHRKVLFGASVHPYRQDAVREIERCVAAGAVLLKWLPITQGFNPSDRRCMPVYEALAHFGLPLLSHTGWEKTLPNIDTTVADPRLLVPALRAGVTVIAAHCGTRSAPGESSFVAEWIRLAQEHEHFYGDTSALNLPTRWYAYEHVLEHPVVREKLVHGSDWPIPSVPHPGRVGARRTAELLRERNSMHRDVLIKQRLGLEDAYWHRAARVLRLPERTTTGVMHTGRE